MTNVRIRAVTKSYRTRLVLKDLDLDVPDGRVLALLGPSGCGKTTLLRLIAGFERADSGEIYLGSSPVESIGHFIPPEKRHIGYVPQEGALFPHLTIAQNIGYGLSRRQRRGERVGDILRLIGLIDYADTYPRELSGGQQQRVALARALAPEPGIILLDEPFNMLDLDLRRKMSEEIVALLRGAETTTLLVTHDPAEAFAVADLVAVMSHGAVMQCGTPAEVYTSPVNAAVARLTGPTIFLEGVVRDGQADTALGQVPVINQTTADDCNIVVLLRPEQVQLTTSALDRQATIVERRFQGSRTVLTVVVGGFAMNISMENPPAGEIAHFAIKGAGIAFEKSSLDIRA